MTTTATSTDLVDLQRRTVRLLVATQVAGGLGIGSAVSVSGLLALDLSGSQVWAGGGGTAVTLGAALVAVPLARLAGRRGRRFSLTLGWSVAAVGALLVVLAAVTSAFWLLLVGLLAFGSGNAANLQSRYTAIDLAPVTTRARDLSVVVWSTTVGSVVGPNLTGPGGALARGLGLPELAGPILFSLAGFVVAGVLVWVRMRPDPLLTAVASRAASLPVRPAGPALPASSALSTVARSPRAVLALATIIGSQAVMVSVMTMTPVQMKGHGATLTLVGLTISLHIAGMYGLSPVFGWLADRWGRVPVLLLGQGTLLLAALVAGTAGQSPWRLGLGLVLLGLGWSAGLISGSTLLAESVPDEARPGVQGTSDLLMNLVGAFGAAASGVVMAVLGFGGVNAVAAVIVLPVLLLAVRARRG
ncbi:MFS transporter [Rhodococcus antarcticus]|uniref:MFS transporter n=1 Tax=Rhodococcus antarcticus TaxID=2987751 RepID=A0ABY6NZP3_9NOCA|nr:MFS transporter [Rhodococcus antarcticus]UZJ24862.1 MFS transporter [Rhodococcus antarcticus]